MEHQHPGHGLHRLYTELLRAAQCDSVTQFKIVFLIDVKEKKQKHQKQGKPSSYFLFVFRTVFCVIYGIVELSEHRGRLGVYYFMWMAKAYRKVQNICQNFTIFILS